MMANTGIDWVSMSDKSIIAAIGKFIKERRLAGNSTQARIAEKAGVNRWTVSQLENGEPVTLMSLVQILRALDALNILDAFRSEKVVSPIALAKAERRKRQRARNKNTVPGPGTGSEW